MLQVLIDLINVYYNVRFVYKNFIDRSVMNHTNILSATVFLH
jgi:hypothetical protein